MVARVPDGWIVVLEGILHPFYDSALNQARNNAVLWHADPNTIMMADADVEPWKTVQRDSRRVIMMMTKNLGRQEEPTQ
jgi:hypothetical protein